MASKQSRNINDGSKLTLQAQGLLLVFGLLAFELPLISALMLMVHWTEQEALHQEHGKKVLAQIDHLGHSIFKAYDNFTPGGGDQIASAYRRDRDDSVATLAVLEPSLKEQRTQKQLLARIKENATRVFAVIDNGFAAVDAASPQEKPQAARRYVGFWKPRTQKLMQITVTPDYLALQQEEKSYVESASRQKQKEQREFMMKLLIMGFLANIVLAVLAAIFFTRGVTSRIALLSDNTSRLSSGLPLAPVMTGKDEISELDRVFHKMASEIDEASKVRQSFVSMIGQELLLPLTEIGSFFKSLNSGGYGEVPAGASQAALGVERSLIRLNSLISELLDMEKLEAGNFSLQVRPCRLAELIERSFETMMPLAKQLGVSLKADGKDAELVADPDRLLQVLLNLISNALKFSERGQVVTVETHRSNDCVEVRVIDHGRGIPEDSRDAVFERFKQVRTGDDSKKGGSGLGLPICKAIIGQHGGAIGVESQEGQGSCFWFRLPVTSSNPTT